MQIINPCKKLKMSVLVSIFLVMVILIACFATACQPTPKENVIVGKGDGTLEKIIAGDPAPLETARDLSVPETIQYDLPGAGGFTVQVEANVSVPNAATYPVMSAARDTITQDQADKIVKALLKGAPLYKPTSLRDKSQIQAQIDYYQRQLKEATTKEGKETYQSYLTGLMKEYEAAPDSQPLQPASIKLEFLEDLPGLVDRYFTKPDKEYKGDSSWTDDARNRAKADGQKAIYGVTAYEPGIRQMQLKIQVSNDNLENHVSFQDFGGYMGRVSDAPPPSIKTLTLDQAITQGKDLLNQMGFKSFSLVNAITEGEIRHELYFKREINGLPQSSITPAHTSKEDYAPSFAGESVTMFIDDSGLLDFEWDAPSKFVATENENVPLLPFKDVQSIFNKQIVLQNQWSPPDDDIVSYRLEINQVKLSYMPIKRANETDVYLYVPVWDFCGHQIARYRDDYPKGQGDHYVLDENNERVVIGDNLNAVSFLTINAIDGSLIDRNKGY